MDLCAAFLPLAREFQAAGEDQWLRCDDFLRLDMPAYLARLQQAAGVDACQTYWVVPQDQQEVVAVTTLHTGLDEAALALRGHIGFRVRPSLRRRGIGTAAVGLTLDRAAQDGLPSVLMVCLQDNLPARRVIHRNGGRHVDDTMLAGFTLQQFQVDARGA
jgi:predicted acetyltransferase